MNRPTDIVFHEIESGLVVFFSDQDGLVIIQNAGENYDQQVTFSTHDGGITRNVSKPEEKDGLLFWKTDDVEDRGRSYEITYDSKIYTSDDAGVFWKK